MLPSPELINQCAPTVAPETVAAMIQVESGGNNFALGINGPVKYRPHPKTTTEAVRWAKYYMNLGYSVDLGLMQINSGNLKSLGYTVEQLFDPCNNLKAGSQILSRGYAGAAKRYGPGQTALKAALSAYNTGNYEQGFHNGYVAKYFKPDGVRITVNAPKRPSPLLANAKAVQQVNGKQINERQPVIPPNNLYTAGTTVYQLNSADNVISWE